LCRNLKRAIPDPIKAGSVVDTESSHIALSSEGEGRRTEGVGGFLLDCQDVRGSQLDGGGEDTCLEVYGLLRDWSRLLYTPRSTTPVVFVGNLIPWIKRLALWRASLHSETVWSSSNTLGGLSPLVHLCGTVCHVELIRSTCCSEIDYFSRLLVVNPAGGFSQG
jgi:hypothetical protein